MVAGLGRILVAAAVGVFAALGVGVTSSSFSDQVTGSAALGSAASFLPVNLSAPVITGTIGLNSTLSVTNPSGQRWGYVHADASGIDTSGEPAVTKTDTWQFCAGGVPPCIDIPGAPTGSSYVINATTLTALSLISLTGAGFRVRENATNSYGAAAAPVYSNILT